MPQIHEITSTLEKLAPLPYQESYDNAGLLVGNPQTEVKGVLISLDVTEEIVAEAIQKGCNLIVAHHPIVFKGLKKLNGKNYVERTVIKAIQNDIAIYATHTNLDHVHLGVNKQIADRLGLTHVKILAPKSQLLKKLTFFSPIDHTDRILAALFQAGAGQIGNYSQCSFYTEGQGTFLPNERAQPFIGTEGKQEQVVEHRAEVMFPAYMESKIISTLKTIHPYEEIAFYIQLLENENQEVGAGAIGTLAEEMDFADFMQHLKACMQTNVIRHTQPLSKKIRTVALCGGAGSFLLPQAMAAKADVYITGDYKYHEFFDADQRILICDIGHYESEVFTKDLLYHYLSGFFSNFALCLSETNTNPIQYYV